MVHPGRGTRTREPTDLLRTGRCQGPLVPRTPTGEPSRGRGSGVVGDTSGTCKTMYLDCPKSYLGWREQQKVRNTRVCGTYCISFWGCALELLKYVMSGTGPTCHCCMICDKQTALVTLPTHEDSIGRGWRGRGL